jgi:hypothetical protein
MARGQFADRVTASEKRVAASNLNMQSRTADEGFSLGVVRGANNPFL